MIASRRFDGSNLGLLTGLSGLTVVDVDEIQDVARAIAIFGPTPLRIQTPRGGLHLYYRSAGERCVDLRPQGLHIDIKGLGGLVIVPPSRRLTSPYEGAPYAFENGDWNTAAELPTINVGVLQHLTSGSMQRDLHQQRQEEPFDSAPFYKIGTRNNRLFRDVLRIALGCSSEQELVDEARGMNDLVCDPPLADDEVLRIARSAWGYQATGRNFASHGGFSCSYDLMELLGHPDALWLYAHLQRAHGGRQKTKEAFAVSPRAMAEKGACRPLGERAIRRARDRLVEIGVLRLVHEGGRGEGDPSLFAFK